MGALNAKIEEGKCGEFIGGFGLGSRNDSGDRLKIFAEEEEYVKLAFWLEALELN